MNLPDCCPPSSCHVYYTSTSPKTLNHLICATVSNVFSGPAKSPATDALFGDYWPLIGSRCAPAFPAVVDGGVNDPALIESKAVALGAVRLPLGCGELRGKDNCSVSKSAPSGVRAAELRAVGLLRCCFTPPPTPL